MKRMSEKAGLGPNLTNHSGRKTMMQTLTNNNIPPTDIIQISGHKNLQSVTNYATVSHNQQMKMSQALSDLATGGKEDVNKDGFIEETTLSEYKRTRHQEQLRSPQQQQALSLFSGASIQGGTFNISINTLNQSPTAESQTTSESSKRYKRIRVMDSDSD